MNLSVGLIRMPPVESLEVEMVERKGRGHPDSICDAIVEQLSRSLSRWYVERFGGVLHHNVDKALLVGGASSPAFGGGRVTHPMNLFIAGRATTDVVGRRVPVEEIAVDGSRAWLSHNLRWLSPEQHVRIHPMIRRGSRDLVGLFRRRNLGEPPLANDSSVGVGYAPLSPLELAVREVERRLNADDTKERHPYIGEDIKVLGIRRGAGISITLAAALVDRFVGSTQDYLDQKESIRLLARTVAEETSGRPVSVAVNTADDPDQGQLYLTVTGTSAEAGDDGQAGRGNRWNGLITPYRSMTLESWAGKNPVSHAGKLYQLAAQRLAEALIAEGEDVTAAECWIASRIGRPITEPGAVDVKISLPPGRAPAAYTVVVGDIVAREMAVLPEAWREAVGGI